MSMLVVSTFLLVVNVSATEIPVGPDGFKSKIAPMLSNYCVKCHGPTKSKGGITLHTMEGDFSTEQKLKRWEAILDAIKSAEMPPESEPQPNETDRKALVQWIEAELRAAVEKASRVPSAATTHRLTNFEYQNTIRDLLGFELKLIINLPEDPVKPYRFNNSAEFMLMGLEQMDRYLECARRALASAIVDPVKPMVHTTKRVWKQDVDPKGGLPEVSVAADRAL